MTQMRNTVLGIGAAVWLALPVQPAHAQGEQPQAKPAAVTEQAVWFVVPQAPRQKLEVLTIDGNWHKGRLRLVADEAIIFDSGRPPIPRDQVWQVWAGGRPSWGARGFWMGLAFGVVAGIAVYVDQGDCADPTSACARDGKFGPGAIAAGGLVFGAGGAILGRLIGGPGREPTLAYAGPTRLTQPARAPDERR